MVRQPHDGMIDNGAVSEAFVVSNGAKHDCFIFSLMVASDMPTNSTNNHDTRTNTSNTTANTDYKDPASTPPTSDPPFTSHIDLIGHLRIHRTETGEPVPGAPTYTRRTCLHRPHSTRTFINHMRLFGHNRVHEYLR
ncbi:hypothetical protein SprV_1002912000 [Sparganum proliferum]